MSEQTLEIPPTIRRDWGGGKRRVISTRPRNTAPTHVLGTDETAKSWFIVTRASQLRQKPAVAHGHRRSANRQAANKKPRHSVVGLSQLCLAIQAECSVSTATNPAGLDFPRGEPAQIRRDRRDRFFGSK
jgi:hypothetical protein